MKPSWQFVLAAFGTFCLVLSLGMRYQPWMRQHSEFILGVLVGSLLELLVVYLSRWTWDRYLWLKWFSHQ